MWALKFGVCVHMFTEDFVSVCGMNVTVCVFAGFIPADLKTDPALTFLHFSPVSEL